MVPKAKVKSRMVFITKKKLEGLKNGKLVIYKIYHLFTVLLVAVIK